MDFRGYNEHMRKHRKFTLQQYLDYLDTLIDYKIIDVFHTQDTMIWFSIIHPQDKHKKFTLMVDGLWKFFKSGEQRASSDIVKGEDDHSYYERLRAFARQIKQEVSLVKAFEFQETEEILTILFDNNCVLEIKGDYYGLLNVEDETNKQYLIAAGEPQLHFYLATRI